MEKLTQEQVAEDLLWSLWASIDKDYKIKYKKNIWEQFENTIRSATYTSSLKGFLELFSKKIPTTILQKYIKKVVKIVESGQDSYVLQMLRQESTYLSMLVRLANEKKKEEYEERKQIEPNEIPEFVGADFFENDIDKLK